MHGKTDNDLNYYNAPLFAKVKKTLLFIHQMQCTATSKGKTGTKLHLFKVHSCDHPKLPKKMCKIIINRNLEILFSR